MGSLLNSPLGQSTHWGTGIIDSHAQINKDAEIHAVRGPLSAARVAQECGTVVEACADPALLLPYIFRPVVQIRYRLGVIPHYVDKTVAKKVFDRLPDDVVLIDVQNDVESFVRDIYACDTIVSSSLHGLIVAAAYGKPVRWIKFGNRLCGDNVKFYDFFASVLGCKDPNALLRHVQACTVHNVPSMSDVHPLQVNGTTPNILDMVAESVVSIDVPQTVTDNLLRACPFLPRRACVSDGRIQAVALMTVFNEQDIIETSIRHLLDDGVSVHVIDNHSTDETPEILATLEQEFRGRLVTQLSQTPQDKFCLQDILKEKEQIAFDLYKGYWIVNVDTDEFRQSPWEGLSLSEAIQRVNTDGYNCINSILVNFRPTDNDYVPGTDFVAHFRHCEFHHNLKFGHEKIWKQGNVKVDCHHSGGHRIHFPDRRFYPLPFLIRHYPIRSQEHGVRKVVRERLSRYSETEKRMGWHGHYAKVNDEYNFVYDNDTLLDWDKDAVFTQYQHKVITHW